MLTRCSGSVFVSGSNPNPDYVAPGPGVTYATEYRVERFYPWYYDKRRPEPKGVPTTLSYGGNYWQATLTAQDLNNDPAQYIQKTKAVVIRTGFSTHAINMSQRLVELSLSYTVNDDGSATLYVSQMPPNPALFAPGPARTSSLPVLEEVQLMPCLYSRSALHHSRWRTLRRAVGHGRQRKDRDAG